MKTLLKKCFANNGVARGLLYFTIQFLTPIGTACAVWDQEAPKTWFAISAVLIGAFVAGLTSVRSFMDQHLSKAQMAATEDKK
jgi:uncharacterized membrane protein (DUF441 family)